MGRNTISQKKYDELKKQLDQMKGPRRRALAQAVGEAREHGDLKENSAYHEAKKDQGLNEAKIRNLEASLDNVRIGKEQKGPKTSVVMGAKVLLEKVDTKEKFEYTIVSEVEADIFENKISTDSPLGSTLYGEKVKAIVEFEAPMGIVKYKILKIS